MAVLETKRYKNQLWATVNRPDAMNSVNFDLMESLEEVLATLENDKKIRSFVLTGSGKEIFISGGDLKEFHGIKSAEEATQMARRMLTILERFERLPCWTVACINGSAYGGGCEITLAFDFRIASSEAKFGFTQGKFCLPPGWGGLTRLVERVGRSTALRWLAEASVIDTETALRYNLVDRTVPPDMLRQKTMEWAETLCENDRDYIQALKLGALNWAQARWEAIEAELEPFSRFWEDQRHHERVERFLNRKENG